MKAISFAGMKRLFARGQAAVGVIPKYSRDVFSEKVLDRFLSQTSPEDVDLILQQAGLNRSHLRRIETDDEVFGALETRLDSVLETPWRLEGAKGDQGEAFEFVWAQLDKHLGSIVTGAWQAVPYGYSVLEAVYVKEEGRVGLATIGEKPLEFFEPQRDGTLIYLNPETGGREPLDLAYKFHLTRRRATYRQPYGESLLSRLYWPWVFRLNGWELWAKFVDRHGDPMLIGTSRNAVKVTEALGRAGHENVVILDQNDKLAVSTQGGSEVFDTFENVITRRIQKLILGQTLTTDNTNGGSNALGKVHAQVKDTKRNSDLKLVSATVQNVVNALWKLNGFAGDAPKFIMQDGKGIEKDRADRDAVLFKMGVKPTEQYIYRCYDFEKGDVVVRDPEEEPEIDPADPSGTKPNDNEDIDDEGTSETKPSKTNKPKAKKAGKFAAGGFTKAQQEVEDAGAGADISMLEPFDTAVLREVVFAATDAQDLADRLSVAMGDVDPEEFEAALGQALFTARVLGYVSAAKEA